MKSAKEYRAEALGVLRGNWKPYVLASLLLVIPLLIIEIPSMLLDKLGLGASATLVTMLIVYGVMFFCLLPLSYAYINGCVEKYRQSEDSLVNLMIEMMKHEYWRGFRSFMRIVLLVLVYSLGLVLLAIAIAYLIILYGMGVPSESLTDWVGNNATTFTGIYMAVFLICFIPVYVWMFAVMLTPYLAHDHKELSIKECMKMSKQLMKGHKWQLFCLQISFIGWALLGMLTCGIGMLWVQPYQYVATAAFYEDVIKEANA